MAPAIPTRSICEYVVCMVYFAVPLGTLTWVNPSNSNVFIDLLKLAQEYQDVAHVNARNYAERVH